MNAAANALQSVLGDTPASTQHFANPSNDPGKFADPSGAKMQALVWHGKNDVRIDEVAKPRIVDPTDVLVKVTGSTVCGSDLHLLHGAIIQLKSGDILGHEYMGVVEEVGSKITKVKPGDRVVASFNIACGNCYACSKKLSSICPNVNTSSVQQEMYGNQSSGFVGYSHFTGGFAGGQSEYVRMPFGDANLLKIPEGVPDETALYLSDVLVTSYHQVMDSGVKEGDIVGIWGLGAIGLLAAKWALLKGASRIIAIDNVQWRLDNVQAKLGPKVELLNYDEFKNVPKRLNELTAPGTHGLDATRPAGIDVALECAAGEYAKGWGHTIEMAVGLETDTSEILNEMIMAVVPFGTVGITGVYAGYTNHFNIGAVMEKGVRLIGNGQAPVHKWWEEILNDYLIPGKLDPRELILTHRIPLEDVPKCYTQMDKHENGIVKTFVETKFSSPPSAGAPPSTRL
ncbi:GroES-like protein [Leucosporidium creatinivorum]|uniref:GroES-like protein n=1 Tax=Leucosporidium creatinivorum TaxID=106004 RepID=A0A1Y2DZM6_9BASI|nr:GroES-like protein [Leucosporidium creatinivorum]